MQSISFAVFPALSSADFAASAAIMKFGLSELIRLSRIPVLVVIHSSVVSMNLVNISLVTTVSGVYSPVPSIVIPFISFSFRTVSLPPYYILFIVDFILFLLYNKSVTAEIIVRKA